MAPCISRCAWKNNKPTDSYDTPTIGRHKTNIK